MSLLTMLCGCLTRGEDTQLPSEPKTPGVNSQNHTRHGIHTGQFILSAEGGFTRASTPNLTGLHGPPPDGSDDGGYASVVPLPQYTPRPMSINEKTLESHLRDPPISSETGFQYEKDIYDGDDTSDNSSDISYPSSYGNTSTATRETPPPAYSPRQSSVFTRSRSISVSSSMVVPINTLPLARVHDGRTSAPHSEADDQSIRRHRRTSWESR
ncbi:hypothetical protein N7495_006736 [Penicillium taxi]|uniref:uncharacterized protein n=1 Tax=Penicillium taxi TaxID=168475 RepID=UPI002544F410|nr:uncharacterized protein N7495_006736 [Penicillium taxi]KAJ5895045.1 hypothetical protein N7495_006736 [Penicillium taxi]